MLLVPRDYGYVDNVLTLTPVTGTENTSKQQQIGDKLQIY